MDRYTGDHIKIDNGQCVKASIASMIEKSHPELVNEWQNSGDNRLFSCWLMCTHWDLFQSEISVRNGSKIRIVVFSNDIAVKVA